MTRVVYLTTGARPSSKRTRRVTWRVRRAKADANSAGQPEKVWRGQEELRHRRRVTISATEASADCIGSSRGLRVYEPCREVNRAPQPRQSPAPVVAALISQPAPACVTPKTRAPANCEGSGFVILHQNRQNAIRQLGTNSRDRL
jgi:hypothetical protein